MVPQRSESGRSRNKPAKSEVLRATEVQRSFGKVLKRVAQDGESLIIERDGYLIAALLPYAEYETWRRERAAKLHRELIAELGPEAEKQGLTEDQLVQDMKATRRRLFEQRYGNLGQ